MSTRRNSAGVLACLLAGLYAAAHAHGAGLPFCIKLTAGPCNGVRQGCAAGHHSRPPRVCRWHACLHRHGRHTVDCEWYQGPDDDCNCPVEPCGMWNCTAAQATAPGKQPEQPDCSGCAGVRAGVCVCGCMRLPLSARMACWATPVLQSQWAICCGNVSCSKHGFLPESSASNHRSAGAGDTCIVLLLPSDEWRY